MFFMMFLIFTICNFPVSRTTILQVLSLTPGTFLESYWLHPQEINSTAYFFNVTNPYEVQHEGAIPVLKEVGPFYYM